MGGLCPGASKPKPASATASAGVKPAAASGAARAASVAPAAAASTASASPKGVGSGTTRVSGTPQLLVPILTPAGTCGGPKPTVASESAARALARVAEVLERRPTGGSDTGSGSSAWETAWWASVDGRAECIRVEVLSRNPPIVLLHDFLSAAEARLVIDIAEPYFSPSVVGLPEEAGYKHDNRTSHSVHEARLPHELAARIERRALAFCGSAHGGVEYMEIIRYTAGQHFREHHDGVHRLFSFVVYLNTLAGLHDGGETCFPALNLRVKPKAGMALLFAGTLPRPDAPAPAPAPRQMPPPPTPDPADAKYRGKCKTANASPLSRAALTTGTAAAASVASANSKQSLSPPPPPPSPLPFTGEHHLNAHGRAPVTGKHAGAKSPAHGGTASAVSAGVSRAESTAGPADAPAHATVNATASASNGSAGSSTAAVPVNLTALAAAHAVEDPRARHASLDPNVGVTKYVLSLFVQHPALPPKSLSD